MAERGQITGGILDGPLEFDNAVSPQAAEIKARSPCELRTLLGSTTARLLRAQRTFAKSLLFCHKHDYRDAEAIGHRT
jgi:hypothetical protein